MCIRDRDIQGIAVGSKIIGGGFEHDGKELAPFDREAARAFFQEMREKGVKSMAISSVFSTVRNDQEPVSYTHLLRALLDQLAQAGYRRASLSVQKENPAGALYRRLDFHTLRETESEYIMVKTLGC